MSRVLPILFNTDMVRAILDGRKTVTRRVIKPQLPNYCSSCLHRHDEFIYDDLAENVYCALCGEPIVPEIKAPYHPGDILYVRETWGKGYLEGTYIYKADDKLAELPEFKESSKRIYRPSIHMPKEAVRIWLKVTDVRVERLQDMTYIDFIREGIVVETHGVGVQHIAEQKFRKIWDSTIKKSDLDCCGWDANPWVWVIEFERCEKPKED